MSGLVEMTLRNVLPTEYCSVIYDSSILYVAQTRIYTFEIILCEVRDEPLENNFSSP